jgi:hypothetical protein
VGSFVFNLLFWTAYEVVVGGQTFRLYDSTDRLTLSEWNAIMDDRKAEREREAANERAWGMAISECDRLHSDPAAQPDLEPFQGLVRDLAAWQRIEWLVEIRDNFRDQLDRGLDSPEGGRLAELWFVNVLLALSESPPNGANAIQLLTEMRQRRFSPFGIGNIARNVMLYVRDHLGFMEQRRREEQKEMLEKSGAVAIELAKRKPAIRRNMQFAVWADEQQMSPADIRDRWNAARLGRPVGKGDAGVGVVKHGITAARLFLNELSKRGFPLTAKQVLERLPQ